jgi:hypothetical protein
MWFKTGLTCTVLLWSSAVLCFAQQNTAGGSPTERHDPATSGAGPTSRAPGLYNYDSPKKESVTTDARGVTTTNSQAQGPKTVPLDRGNENIDSDPR